MASQNKPREGNISYRRLLEIDKEIASGSYPSTARLAEITEASTPTVKRDIDHMRLFLNAPVQYSKLHEGWYYEKNAYRLPALFTNEQELFAASLTKNLAEALHGTSAYDGAKTVLSALSSPVGNPMAANDKMDTSWIDNRILFIDDTHFTMESGSWDKICSALHSNCELSLKYKGLYNKVYYEHTVQPYQLLYSMNLWTLWCYDSYAKSTRLLQLNRMKDVCVTKLHFKLPVNYDYRKVSDGTFGLYVSDTEYNFKIRFYKTAVAFAYEHTWGKNQKIEKQSDGSVIVYFTSCQYEPVLRFVLSSGSNAVPLGPEKFVIGWKNEVKKMAASVFDL